MEDRIRAKPPNNDVGKWIEGVIESYSKTNGRYSIVVSNNEKKYDLDISSSIFDLFESRMDSSSIVGETVWFRKKGLG